jgi:hypothetical protein
MILKDFKYLLDYDYSSYTDCSNSGCDDEGICRCSTIENECVKYVYINQIVESVFNNLSPSGISKLRNDRLNLILPDNDDIINKYGIWRLSVIHKLWNTDLYDISVEGGYYGQEIGEITLDSKIQQKWEADCITFWNLDTLKEKIFFLLEKEYGNVLPNLKNLTPKLITICFDDIDWKSTNHNHITNVNKKNCDYYNDNTYKLPRGIVRNIGGGKYQLVDGYHRILHSNNLKFDVYSFE